MKSGDYIIYDNEGNCTVNEFVLQMIRWYSCFNTNKADDVVKAIMEVKNLANTQKIFDMEPRKYVLNQNTAFIKKMEDIDADTFKDSDEYEKGYVHEVIIDGKNDRVEWYSFGIPSVEVERKYDIKEVVITRTQTATVKIAVPHNGNYTGDEQEDHVLDPYRFDEIEFDDYFDNVDYETEIHNWVATNVDEDDCVLEECFNYDHLDEFTDEDFIQD